MGEDENRRNIDDVVETLKNAKKDDRACTLLVGAGCSKSAGVPLAKELIHEVKRRHPYSYQRMEAKCEGAVGYKECMAALTEGQRRDLIDKYIKEAKLNMAHVCIALLMQHDYVDRILTTNFDPLIIQACTLMGFVPAIYDLAATQLFVPEYVPEKSVFYLHGLYTGFVLLSTDADFRDEYHRSLARILGDKAGSRVWLVVGYSGNTDPVFHHLAEVEQFYQLYWVEHLDKEPSEEVKKNLIGTYKNTCWLNGFEADSFFMGLANKLGFFPPAFSFDPLTHMEKLLDHFSFGEREWTDTAQRPIQPAIISDPRAALKKRYAQFQARQLSYQELLLDLADTPRRIIQRAKELLANEAAESISVKDAPGPAELKKLEAEARRALFSADYEKVLALAKKAGKGKSASLSDTEAWAHVMRGNGLRNQAMIESDPTADKLFRQACEEYQAALKIKKDMREAYNNWGLTLVVKADKKRGKEADRLFEHAYEKYDEALRIKKDYVTALINFGLALMSQARTKDRSVADVLFSKAYEKYDEGLEIEPDSQDVLNSWGHALVQQAQAKEGDEADGLFKQAYDKFEEAINLKPDSPQAPYYDYGLALFIQASTKEGPLKGRLCEEAQEKFLAAEELKPGIASYFLAILAALRRDEDQTRQWLEKSQKMKTLPSCDDLKAEQAFESFRAKKWFQDFLAQVCPES